MERIGKRYNENGTEQLCPAKYNHITLEVAPFLFQQRTTLIDMVDFHGFSIYRAAKVLQINNSTAKAILRSYRRRRHIYKRKSQRNNQKKQLKIKMEVEPSPWLQNDVRANQMDNAIIPKIEPLIQEEQKNIGVIPCFFYYVSWAISTVPSAFCS